MSRFRVLTEHFFLGLFRSEFFSEAGVDAYRTWVVSVACSLIAFHLVLPRFLVKKYYEITRMNLPELFRQVVVADELFLITICFALFVLLTAIQWQALFPGERDFLVLTPLPLRRIEIFLARLMALALFMLMFVIAIDVPPAFIFPALAVGRPFPVEPAHIRIFAHLVSGGAASIFAFTSVLALQGLILIAAPKSWRPSLTFGLQIGLLGITIAILPALFHIPGLYKVIEDRPEVLNYLPPVWFLGICEVLRGNSDPWHQEQASRAVVGLLCVSAMGTGAYALLYRRFSQFAAPPMERRERPSLLRLLGHPLLEFIGCTLARSGQHRLLLAAIAAAGAALAIDGFVGALTAKLLHRGEPGTLLESAAFALPLLLSFSFLGALRFSFRLPIHWPAHWIFRITETPAARLRWVRSAERSLQLLGLAPALLLPLPLLCYLLGVPRALATVPLYVLFDLILMECWLIDWRLMPFTSAWSPSSRPAAHSFVIYLFAFSFFGYVGGILVSLCSRNAMPWMIFGALLLTVWISLRRHRLQEWGEHPLLFEETPEPAVLRTGFASE